MLHYELNTGTFIIVLLSYTFIHSSCLCAEIHVAETIASYLYILAVYFAALSVFQTARRLCPDYR